MTAPTAYTTLDSDDLGANKILRAATMSALDSNPVAIAQRNGAPWLNGIGAIISLTSGSGNWTVPMGFTGSRPRSSAAAAGGNNRISWIVWRQHDLWLGDGEWRRGGSNISGGSGGSASGGDINMTGETGAANGYARASVYAAFGRGGNAFGASPANGGGSGATSIDVISVEPGDLIAYWIWRKWRGRHNSWHRVVVIEY